MLLKLSFFHFKNLVFKISGNIELKIAHMHTHTWKYDRERVVDCKRRDSDPVMGSTTNCRRYDSSSAKPPEIFVLDCPNDDNNNLKKKYDFIRGNSADSFQLGFKRVNSDKRSGDNAQKHNWRRKGTRGTFFFIKFLVKFTLMGYSILFISILINYF